MKGMFVLPPSGTQANAGNQCLHEANSVEMTVPLFRATLPLIWIFKFPSSMLASSLQIIFKRTPAGGIQTRFKFQSVHLAYFEAINLFFSRLTDSHLPSFLLTTAL